MMKIKRMAALCFLLVPALALAGWFGGEKKNEPELPATSANRRYVLKIPDKATERELVRLIRIKQILQEEQRVLSLLTEEKKAQIKKLQAGLHNAFSMDPATNYQYDPKTRTIYELIPSGSAMTSNQPLPGASTVPTTGFDRKLHLQLVSDAQVRQFLQLTTGKQLVEEELKTFSAVVVEKQAELERVSGLLSEKFSISKDKNYEYEPTTKRLHEVDLPAAVPAKTSTATDASAIQLRASFPSQISVSGMDDEMDSLKE